MDWSASSAEIPKAKHSFKITQKQFVTSTATYLQVIDAERTLLEFQITLERALVNRAQRLAEIEALCGGTIR